MAFQRGTALVMREGELFNPEETERPSYIAAESLPSDNNGSLLCYPITSNMIFEVPIIGDPTYLYEGSKVLLSTSSGYACAVSDVEENGVATIFDMNGAEKSGDHIYVRFNY